ncbi:MAG: aminotransferase class IV [Rhizobiaceae bacterium]|nr:aminotransferase class IV [Rhizobiaceae bacterium]
MNYSIGAAFVDGSYISIDQAKLPIMDWGFLRSDATYDVAHVWRGRFFRLDDHIDRFERGIAKLRMSLPVSRKELRDILFRCVQLCGLQDAYVEMICTRGIPLPGSRDPRTCKNAFYAFAVPFISIADPEAQRRGISLRISNVVRIPSSSVDPTIKNYHWHDFTRGLFYAYDQGDDTVVLTDGDRHVLEGPGFNIFMVYAGEISTPSTGILEGITRKTVLELAMKSHHLVKERLVSIDELRSADEIFITSTAGGIIPITRLDGKIVGSGAPGSTTLDLKARYWDAHNNPEWNDPI